MARVSRPAGAADPVNIGLRLVGQVVVDHVAQAGNIDAPGRDVRGDQDFHLAAFEAVQGGLPRVLTLIAVDAHGLQTGPLQIPHDAVHAVLGPAENQGVLHLRAAQQLRQEVFFIDLIHVIQALIDGLHRGGDGIHLDVGGGGQQVQGELLHLRGHGGGKQQRLPLLGQGMDDAAHVVDEAHVQHPVRLVQHEDFHPVQPDDALTHQVHQAAGAGDDDVRALVQGLGLRALAHAAEHDAASQRQPPAVGLDVFRGLEGQLPGRRQNQRPDDPGLRPAGGPGQQLLQNGQGKGRRFAGARLSTAKHILPGKNQGDGGILNRGGLLISCEAHVSQQGGEQPQGLKTHESVCSPFIFVRRNPGGGRRRLRGAEAPHRGIVQKFGRQIKQNPKKRGGAIRFAPPRKAPEAYSITTGVPSTLPVSSAALLCWIRSQYTSNTGHSWSLSSVSMSSVPCSTTLTLKSCQALSAFIS